MSATKKIMWFEVPEGQTSGVVEVPAHAVTPAGGKSPCGCHKAAGALDVEVDTATVAKIATVKRARLVGGAMVGEPLFAVAEGAENRVACCETGCGEAAGTPNAIVFDHYAVAEDGYEHKGESAVVPLPEGLISSYASRRHTCLPWVRVQRDPERFRKCLEVARKIGPMQDSTSVVKLVGPYLRSQEQEVFLVVLLSSQNLVLAISEISRGGRSSAQVPVPDTLRIAIVGGAVSMIVCHNHPSGVSTPSPEDVRVTETLKVAAETVGLHLLDHVIIGRDAYSFAQHHKI